MKTTAAVLVELGHPLELADLEMPRLQPGQVLVEIAYSGVCHTQLLEASGGRGHDAFLPHCLGHEGSGYVREIGPGVTKIRPDDRVILSWIQGSGINVPGATYQWGDRRVNAGGITTFSRHAVISENRLTRLPSEIDLRSAVLMGCALPTGLGAVMNTARPRPGESLVVFGVGGVGLCAIAGAAVSGCQPVIAVDVRPTKLELARQMGATHTIAAGETDPLEALKALCPGGVDFAVECSGQTSVMRQALSCVRRQGGVAVIVGNARQGEKLELDPQQFNQGKQLRGTWGGDNWPDRDFPRYGQLLAAGRLAVDPLLAKSYPLKDINAALTDLKTGQAARPAIDMTLE